MIERYPLAWPANIARTPAGLRKRAQFKKTVYGANFNTFKLLSVADAVARIEKEFDDFTRVGHDYRVPPESIIISTNLPPGKKGKPLSSQPEPSDPGVAVYFTIDGRNTVFPCDKWNRVADNLAAVAAHILAIRKIEHYGVGEGHEIYTGFKALPENAGISNSPWWEVLQVKQMATRHEVNDAWRKLSKQYHPDMPTGNADMFDLVQKAYREAKMSQGNG